MISVCDITIAVLSLWSHAQISEHNEWTRAVFIFVISVLLKISMHDFSDVCGWLVCFWAGESLLPSSHCWRDYNHTFSDCRWAFPRSEVVFFFFSVVRHVCHMLMNKLPSMCFLSLDENKGICIPSVSLKSLTLPAGLRMDLCSL